MSIGRASQASAGGVRVALLLDQAGEIEAVLPVMLRAETRGDLAFSPFLTPAFVQGRPRMTEHLVGAHGATLLPEAAVDDIPLAEFDLALAPVVSNHPRHALAQRFIRRARVARLTTATLQHGLDNVGISRSHDIGNATPYVIETDIVCVWFPEDHIPAQCAPSLRSRLAHTGRAFPDVTEGRRDVGTSIGVFENLHWNLYDDGFRKAFQSHLRQTAAAFPQVRFVVKPHPGGRWLPRFGEGGWPANIEVFDPDDDIARYDAFDVIRGLSAVITTPSTIVLDAAWLERPVALIPTEGADLYGGLDLLDGWEAWRAFVAQVEAGCYDRRGQSAFLARSIRPGDGAGAICDALVGAVR